MNVLFNEADVLICLHIYSKKLTDVKKSFIQSILDKYGPVEALKALYNTIFVVKDEKELLTYKF